ncbi:TonB-dependent receptor [Thalassotalea piscium]
MKTFKKNKTTLFLLAVLPLTSTFVQAYAAEEDEDQATVERIQVTAQRRVQNLQQTPVSITAIGEDGLASKQISRLDDLSYEVPNLIIAPNTGTSSGAKIFMRGVGEDNSTFTNDPAIGLYVDGVFFARQTGALIDIYDLERIEVLRGPQGTLYGRNTSGGAIKYISKKPQGNNESYVQAIIGNMGKQDIKFAGDYAVSEDLAVQVAAIQRNRDGYSYNTTLDTWVNDQDVFSARIGALWSIDSSSSLYVNMDMITDDSTAGYASNILNDEDNDVYTLESNATGKNQVKQKGLNLTYKRQINDTMDLEIIAARRTLENPWHGDFDGKAAVVLEDRWFLDQSQTSIEAQLSGSTASVDWLAGVFAFNETNEMEENVDVLTQFLGPSPTNFFDQDTDSYAVFTHGTYKLQDNLNITGGLRYTSDKKEITVDQIKPDGSAGFNSNNDHSWSNVSYKLGVDYQLNDDVMLFLNTASGYKSGGFAVLNSGELRTFNEENNVTYEVGFKSSWLNNQLTLNTTYFFSQYDDLQLSAWDDDGNTVRINAADTDISGLEIEIKAAVTSNWHLNATVGTLDAEYKEARSPITTDLDLKQAPDLRWSLGSQVYFELESGEIEWAINVNHTDEYFQNVANSTLGSTNAYTLINSRVSFTNNEGNISVSLWGKNLSDEQYTTGSLLIEGLGIGAVYTNLPRSYGADLTYRF